MTWDDHKKNFARLARDGGYTIAQYAAEFNLNPNTARRYLRAFKEDTGTADSRKPNKPVRKPLKSMIIDHANDQRAGDYVVAEMAEKQKVNAVVSAAVENAKRQNKRINDRSDDHDVITRAHRTLRDRLERDTLDDDGERFEFEAGDYLIDNVEARKAARAMLRRSGADVLETTLLEKSLSHLLMLENARDTDDEENQTASGAPSLEDLDKIARERAASRRADAALWIEHRREEIADIVDTGGYGDVDAEGISNEAWLEQDLDEDEEEDEEVTRKLYGDDD